MKQIITYLTLSSVAATAAVVLDVTPAGGSAETFYAPSYITFVPTIANAETALSSISLFNPSNYSSGSQVFLAVYAANASTLLGVSLNSQRPSSGFGGQTPTVWNFKEQGGVTLASGSTYVVKLFTDAAATTPYADIRVSTAAANPNVAITGNAWDPAIKVVTVPEASTALLGAAGALAMLRRRRA